MYTLIFTCCRNIIVKSSFFLFLLFFAKYSVGQPILSVTPVINTGLSSPIQFVNAGDGTGRIFIVQQGATIRAYDSSFNFLSVFLTVSNVNVGGERGLLSMAFHPDYANNGFFYVYYTNTAGDLEIARYHVSSNPNVADPASKVIVITIPHPTNSNHNGGELHFNNADGYLYLSTGDGGGGGDVPNNAQNTNVLLGKVLRFNVNTSATAPFYSIPAGNPYGNEVFDLGLRNPYRWSFDRLTNDMWIGDVGQDSFEEIDYRAAGSTGGINYGWRCYEGNNTYNTTGCGPMANYVFPAYSYPSQNPAAAITGGIVYRGAMPSLYGYYVAADFYSGLFYMIQPNGAGGWVTATQQLSPNGIVDFGETENGEAYVVSLLSNAVYRLTAVEGGPLPVNLLSFTGAVVNQQAELKWKTAFEQNLQQFDVEYSADGNVFTAAGTVQAQHSNAGADYTFTHVIGISGNIFYRLKMIDRDGTIRYSNTIRLTLNKKNGGYVSPSVVTDGIIHVDLDDSGFSGIEVVSTSGVSIIKRKLEAQSGRVNLPTGLATAGIYMVKLIRVDGSVITQRIFIQ